MPEPQSQPQQPQQPQLKYLVRIADTDLDGKKTLLFAMSKIKGIGVSFANAVCAMAKVDKTKKTGALTDDEISRLEKVIENPLDEGITPWLFNRRKDLETGKDKHVIANDLIFNIENDIKAMKKMKSYKGVRHIFGLPVRGQRTRSKFRKNKGKVVGVKLSKGAKKGGKV